MQNFSKLIIVANFEMNKEYIAKNLCVQKDVKDNCCQGSCHLKTELEADENTKELPGTPTLKDNLETSLYHQNLLCLGLQSPGLIFDNFTPYKQVKLFAYHPSVFHPPLV